MKQPLLVQYLDELNLRVFDFVRLFERTIKSEPDQQCRIYEKGWEGRQRVQLSFGGRAEACRITQCNGGWVSPMRIEATGWNR